MKEIRKTYIEFTTEEASTLERAREICQTGADFFEDNAVNELFQDIVNWFDVLEEYCVDQFDYNESEIVGTYETEFMNDDTYSEDIEYDEEDGE